MIQIKGPRVTLRTMTRAEYHAGRKKYVADPIMDPNPYVYDAERTDAAFDVILSRGESYPITGIFLENGEQIGVLSFKRIDKEKSRCELGIMLYNDTYKGKGYGREAFAVALTYAFDVLGLDAVYADTMGTNVRMQRILERLGFQCYLRLQDCYDMVDRWEDRLDYVVRRAEIREMDAGDAAKVNTFLGGARCGLPLPEDAKAVFLAYAKGQMVGVLALLESARVGLFFVEKKHRRQGHGGRLLEAAAAWAAACGAREITAQVDAEFEDACVCFGFVRDGEAGPEGTAMRFPVMG